MIAAFFLGFLTATLLCAVPPILAYRALRKRERAYVDYRDRWLAAVALLGDTGRLTDEQVRSLKGDAAMPQPPAITPVSAPEPAPAVTLSTLKTLHRMYSDDRRKLEVTRALKGLPPLDDLKGMYSDDKRKVLEARAKHGTG